MPKYDRFEDLPIWQDARAFVTKIYQSTQAGAFGRDYGLRDQLQRAAVSVMNNIAEGFERRSKIEFVQFLNYAKGSAGECRSMIYIAKDLAYIDEPTYEDLYSRALSLSKAIAGFAKYLKGL